MMIVLGSNSPRRIEFLKNLAIPFLTFPPDIDESILPQEAPRAMVARLSQAKAMATLELLHQKRFKKSAWILTADTTVAIDGHILGKPKHASDAIKMLDTIQGRTHEVLTGFTLISPSQAIKTKVVKTLVTLRPLNPREIRQYVRTGESFDKAGAYGAQGIGMTLISRIQGSYTNVVGLPVSEFLETLAKMQTQEKR